MIPTSLLITASFAFLQLPVENSKVLLIKKENEVKNYTSQSIVLNLSSSDVSPGKKPGFSQKAQPKTGKLNLVLPPELFTEPPLQMDEWMITPKNWKNNKDLKKEAKL